MFYSLFLDWNFNQSRFSFYVDSSLKRLWRLVYGRIYLPLKFYVVCLLLPIFLPLYFLLRFGSHYTIVIAGGQQTEILLENPAHSSVFTLIYRYLHYLQTDMCIAMIFLRVDSGLSHKKIWINIKNIFLLKNFTNPNEAYVFPSECSQF